MTRINGETTDKDMGREKLLRELGAADGATVDTGIFDGEKHPESPEYTLAQILAVHEFGTKDGRIPERSTIRAMLRKKGKVFEQRFDHYLKLVAEGKTTMISALTAFGEETASELRREITELRDPPLAASTIKKTGRSNPLVHTGVMRNKVHSQITVGLRKKKAGQVSV
jgi:hypothetical protein